MSPRRFLNFARSVVVFVLCISATTIAAKANCPTDGLDEKKPRVTAEALLAAMKQVGPRLECSGVSVIGALDFGDASDDHKNRRLQRSVNLTGAEFKGLVKFVGVTFDADLSLGKAVFRNDVFFYGSTFNRMADFFQATFHRTAEFRTVRFKERALFSSATFHGKPDFALAGFEGITFFNGAKFMFTGKNGAEFLMTRVRGDVYFARARFEGLARFMGSQFLG